MNELKHYSARSVFHDDPLTTVVYSMDAEAALAERDTRIEELERAIKTLHGLHGTNFGYVLANTVDTLYHQLFPEEYNPHGEPRT